TGAQHSGRLTGDVEARFLAEPEPQKRFVQGLRTHAQANFRGANVRGMRQHLGNGEPFGRVRVADHDVVDGHLTVFTVELLGGRDRFTGETRGDGEDLHRRTGLEAVGNGAIAALRRLA